MRSRLTILGPAAYVSPKWMAGPDGGPLTAPSAGLPEDVALGFLAGQAALLGLTPREIATLEVSSIVPAPDGGAHAHFLQRVGGLEVFDSHALVNVNPDGSIRSLGSSVWRGLRIAGNPRITAAEALRLAMANAYPEIPFSSDVVERHWGQRASFWDLSFTS